MQGPVDMARRIGESVMFTCIATGVPLPNITWSSSNSGSITVDPNDDMIISVTTRQSQIMLSNLALNNFTTYTCTATNQFGMDTTMALLQCKMSTNAVCNFVMT